MLPNYNNELNKILFKTNGTLSVPAGNESNIGLAGTAVKNLLDYGFVVDERGLNLLATSSKEEIEKWYFDTLIILKDEVDITSIKPTYPNFPNEIMSRTDWESMINEFKDLWKVNPSQERDETNQNQTTSTNGDNNSDSNTDGNGDNNEDNTNAGRDTINLGYEPESKIIINNSQQQYLGIKESKKPKIITTIDGRDKRLVIDTTAQIFKHTLRTKSPTKTQMKEIINPFIENVHNWNAYVTQCVNRDMLTYLYARALIDAKKVDNMPDLKAKEYLEVAQQVNRMKEYPTYEVRQLNDKEKEKVAEYCKKNNTTPDVARRQLFNDCAVNKKDFSKNMQIKSGPKYELEDVKVPKDTFVKITSCGDKLSGHKLRQFIVTGLEKIPDLETEISGKKSEKMWKSIFDKQLHIKSDFPQLEKVSMINTKLQNNVPLANLDREIEKAKREERYEDILKLLSNRPNAFVKRINEMLNLPIKNPEQRLSFAVALLQTAQETLPKAKSEDLVTFINYLKSRTRDDRVKVHNVMGKLYIDQEKTYSPLPPKTVEAFTNIAKKALGAKLVVDNSIGVVYIEPEMEKMALPKNSNIENQDNVYSKGSRMSIANENAQTNKVRFAIWINKKDNKPTTNKQENIKSEETHRGSIIDISASFFKEENGTLQHQSQEDIAWYANKENSYDGCNSSGNAIIENNNKLIEFIDLDLQSLQDADVAYVMLYVNVWSDNTLLNEENINFGWGNVEITQEDVKEIQSNVKSTQKEVQEKGEDVVQPSVIQLETTSQVDEPIVENITPKSTKRNNIEATKAPSITMEENDDVIVNINETATPNAPQKGIETLVVTNIQHSKKEDINDTPIVNNDNGDMYPTTNQPQISIIGNSTKPNVESHDIPQNNNQTVVINKTPKQTSTFIPINQPRINHNNAKRKEIKVEQGDVTTLNDKTMNNKVASSQQKKSQIEQSDNSETITNNETKTPTNIDGNTQPNAKKITTTLNKTNNQQIKKDSFDNINTSTTTNHVVNSLRNNPMNHICKLTGNAKGIVPVILDVKQKEVIWINTLDRSSKSNLDMRNFTKYANVLVDMYGKNDKMTMADMAKLITAVNNGTITTNPLEAKVLFTTKKHDGQTIKQMKPQPQTIINVVAIQPEMWLKQLMSPVGKSTEELELQKQLKTQANKSLLDAFEAIIIEQERKNNILRKEAEEKTSSADVNIIEGMEMDQKIMEQKINPEKAREETMKAFDEAVEQFAKELEEEQQLIDILENFAISYDKNDNDEPTIDDGDEEEFELD